MYESKRHEKTVINQGINKHKGEGDIPRAESYNPHPKRFGKDLKTSEIHGVFRNPGKMDQGVIVQFDDGFYNVRVRQGVKHKGMISQFSFPEPEYWTYCPKDGGWSNFKDDFTIKEAEYHLYQLMDSGTKLSYWLEEGYDQIVIPTNLENRPTEFYANESGLNIDITEVIVTDLENINRNYLKDRQVSNDIIERLNSKGYLNDVLLSSIDHTSDLFNEVQAEIRADKFTKKKRKKRITAVRKDVNKLEKVLKEYYPELGRFEIRDAYSYSQTFWRRLFGLPALKFYSHSYLLLWDVKGVRIYHSLWKK